MLTNELGIQEINQYYTRRGGCRSASLHNFANLTGAVPQSSFASQLRIASAQNVTSVSEASQPAEEKGTTVSSSSDSNTNECCESCRLTRQLVLQMMSRSLYTSSGLGLGYSAAGAGTLSSLSALSAYQSMLNLIGS